MSAQFRLIYEGAPPNVTYGNAAKAFHRVDDLRREWAAGGAVGCLTVQVDEGLGCGWETYEYINFAEEAS